MRIGVICYPTYGGSGVVGAELGRSLAKRGHQVHFISSEMPFRLADEIVDNITFHEVQSFAYPLYGRDLYPISLASKIIQIALEQGLEIIHAHYAIPHAISGWIAREALGSRGPRLVTTLHGTDITLVGRAPSFFPVVKFALAQSDAITAVSAWLARETREEFEPIKPVEVIPNFVDADRFRPNRIPCRRSRFAPKGEKILMHVSNFRPVKRLDDVMNVFALVKRQISAKLLLIGDGPEYDRTVQLARELGVADSVQWLGKQDHIESFYSCADVFLLPSEYESFGLAAAEAMASGLPVVASRAGGIPEVIKHGETGFLAPVGDVEAMSEFALQLLRDDDFRKAMGVAARADMVARFDPARVVSMYENLYERVLKSEPVEIDGIAGNALPRLSGAVGRDN